MASPPPPTSVPRCARRPAAATRLTCWPASGAGRKSLSPTAADRVTLYCSTQPFTEAAEAHELHGPEGAWTAQAGGVAILCGRGSHSLLILRPEPAIVGNVGAILGAL